MTRAVTTRIGRGERWGPLAFAAPAILYLLAFQFLPLAQEAYLSLTATSLLSPQRHVWVGLENFADLVAAPEFRQTLAVTVVYVVACVAGAIGLGLGSALLLDRAFPGRGVARALVTLPWAAPPVAVALVFTWIFNAQYGVLGRALRALGLPGGSENWLDSPALALPAVLLVTIWQIFPFSSVVLLAALQGVQADLVEAAVVDGARRTAVFRYVVWPTIRPTVLLLALFVTIWSLRRFDLVWILTQGGPIGATNTLVVDLYRQGFVHRELGLAAAVGMVGLVLALVATLAYVRLERRLAT